jgi:hypothetical protein
MRLKGSAMENAKKGTILLVGAAMLTAVAAAGPARAQEDQATAHSAVVECLCSEQALRVLGPELRAERRRYDRRRADAEALERQVEASRSGVDVNNRGDIEAFKALVEKRDAARDAFDAESARYAAAVARYNHAVAANNDLCTGRLFDPAEMAAARRHLFCPRP